jgi:hypothetical protein
LEESLVLSNYGSEQIDKPAINLFSDILALTGTVDKMLKQDKERSNLVVLVGISKSVFDSLPQL